MDLTPYILGTVVHFSILVQTELFAYFLSTLLIYFLRIGIFHFQAGGRKRQPNRALVFFSICPVLLCILLPMRVSFCVGFCFLVQY